MEKLILVTNDDGYQAKGIQTLARLMSHLGEVVVVAPDSARSGAGCSITPTRPVEIARVPCPIPVDGLWGPHPVTFYACSGTPVDCVKLASEQVLQRQPDLLASGINHGDNASISLHYSGTIGACIEGCLKGWPSVGFSLRTFRKDADFAPFEQAIAKVARSVLEEGLPADVLLNVNFPEVAELQGVRLARMARGQWSSEWADAHRPYGNHAFWLTGQFTNLEPDAEDTDYWAIDHGYAAITPLQLDMTAHGMLRSSQLLAMTE